MLIDLPVVETLAPEDGAFMFRDESILGTRMLLMFVADSCRAAHEAALAVRAEIDRLNLIFNGRRPDSELFSLNAAVEFNASPELFAVVTLAEYWRVQTGGAFNARLGRVIRSWRTASNTPHRDEVAALAQAAQHSTLILEPTSRTIVRPDAIEFALDGIAKGWILDRAFAVACSMPGISGALVDIGGDMRCSRTSPAGLGWPIDIADPSRPFDNSPSVATVRLHDRAIATSGRGVRDRVLADKRYSPTLDPCTGWPIERNISASVIASTAADADALATALLVLPADAGVALAENHATAARITMANGEVAQTSIAATHFTAIAAREKQVATPEKWQEGWQALATFTAPRRQLIRDPLFRSPYMAMWITDLDNRPVRTLILIGKRADWQKDNFIWWSMNRARTERLVSTRSMSTSAAGVYNVFWDGVDDAGRLVNAGTYVLHVETSRERGKHTYRSLTLAFGKFQRFTEVLPPTEEGGGLKVSFDHY